MQEAVEDTGEQGDLLEAFLKEQVQQDGEADPEM